MFVDFNILNQLGSPSINSNTFANRPAAGQTGRLFVSTDTFEIYRDNGTTWDLIGGPGSSTITGTGTATQVAYFTSSQAIGSSSNLYWDNTNIRLGIGTSTPGTRLDIHGTGIMQHINATGATANSLMAFQRTGTNVWRLGDQYNGGSNFFELHNTALASNAIQIDAATNKSIFTSVQNYVSGLARANYFDYTLNLGNFTTISSPNAVTSLGATLNLNISGSATLPNGARSGMDVFNGVNFTSAGTFTINQASTIRAFSNLTSGWAFNGSDVGTITHLAGMRVLFPTNSGSAINVTNNYALLINNQNANTGTINYTNRWGIYQEGTSDLNYMAANLLLGSTTNTGDKLQVTGTATISSSITANSIIKSGGTSSQYLMADGSTSTLTNPVTGSGTTNYIPKFTSSSAIGNSNLINDASGNLGLGQAPNSTWIANSKAIQIKDWTSLSQRTDGAAVFGMNIVETSSNSYSYLQSFSAGRYQINGNEHTWHIAPSGTAGNAISFTQAMTLDASGRLLLGGTVSSGAKLQVISSTSTTTAAPLLALGQSSNGSDKQLMIWNDLSNNYFAFQGLTQNVGWNQNIVFQVNGGNLGIGTTNPIQPLTVQASASAQGIALLGRATGNTSRIDFYNQAGNSRLFTLEADNTIFNLYADVNIPMVFSTNATERMRITSGGLVNILSTSTNTTFTSGGTLGIKNSAGDPYISWHANDGSRIGYLQMQGSGLAGLSVDVNQPLAFYTNAQERMRITSGGNVLIGTTTDAGYKLDVSGFGRFTNDLITDNRIITSNPAGGTATKWKLGAAATVSPTSPNRTIRVEIDGTTYYIAAKTTND